jgi:hypothetical protein
MPKKRAHDRGRSWFRSRQPKAKLPTRQVDRLLAGDPKQVAVRISSLPGRREDLVELYSAIFSSHGYDLMRLDPSAGDEVEAIFERRRDRVASPRDTNASDQSAQQGRDESSPVSLP